MKTLLTLCLLLLPLRALAFCDGWRTSDTVLTTMYVTLLHEDWRQTKQVAGSRLYAQTYTRELNPVLGPRPSNRAIDTWFTSVLVGSLAAACIFDDTPRTTVLAFLAGVEFNAVDSNWQLGFHGSF